ncbi:hypothetical protein SRHO_G00071100 [Serrasalmus rhombeus]
MFQARDAEAIIIILIKRERLHFHSYHSADFHSRCVILTVLSDGLVEGEREASSAAGREARRSLDVVAARGYTERVTAV